MSTAQVTGGVSGRWRRRPGGRWSALAEGYRGGGGVGVAAAGFGVDRRPGVNVAGDVAEDPGARADSGQGVGGENHGGGRPGRPLGREVGLVDVLPAGPVGAVLM